jgi:serine/threonine-protein kinase HipA
MMDNNGVWTISPAYDITYANGQGHTKNHQLSLKGKVNDFTMEDILSLAKEHSIDEKWTRECVQNIVEIVSTFPMRAKEIGIHRDFISLVSKDHRSF